MSTSDLVQRMPAVLIFSLTFTFLTSTVTASENSVGRIPFLISSQDEAPAASQEASAIPEQASSNWGSMLDLRYVEREDTDPTGNPRSLAEVYLKRLAEEHSEDWKRRGRLGLVGSALGVAGGVYYMVTSDVGYHRFAGAALAISGVFMGSVGVHYLSSPSRVEREIDRLLSITDSVQRERVGQETLASLAHSARRAQIFSAISVAGFAVAWGYPLLIESYEPVDVAVNMLCTGCIVYSALSILTSESPEEIAFQKYLEERRQGQAMRLQLGVGPSGRVQVALVLSF